MEGDNKTRVKSQTTSLRRWRSGGQLGHRQVDDQADNAEQYDDDERSDDLVRLDPNDSESGASAF